MDKLVVQNPLALLSLMRLVSPALPVGTYSYSQGFEFAIDSGCVKNKQDVTTWLQGVMQTGICHLEIPLLRNCYRALAQDNVSALIYWNQEALAARESSELRLEDMQMGKALWRLLTDLNINLPELAQPSWVAAYSIAAFRWQISLPDAAYGFVWSWLENQLMVAAKLVPLGQTDVQRLTGELIQTIPDIVSTGLQVEDDDIGMGMPGLVLASMQHETQYSRLFRS
jgi:urease accessory protein